MHADFARICERTGRNARADLPGHTIRAQRTLERRPIVAERLAYICERERDSSPAAKVVDFGVRQTGDQPAVTHERRDAHRKSVRRPDDVRPIGTLEQRRPIRFREFEPARAMGIDMFERRFLYAFHSSP